MIFSIPKLEKNTIRSSIFYRIKEVVFISGLVGCVVALSFIALCALLQRKQPKHKITTWFKLGKY